jgi:hypothetical protein
MTSGVSLEGVKRAVFFPFQGKNWSTKVVLGAAVNFANFIIPVVPMVLLLGYIGQVMKRVIVMDADPELPEWNDWGTFFRDGLKIFGVLAIYNLPGILLMVMGYFLMFIVGMGVNFITIAFSAGNSPASAPFFFGTLASLLGTFGGILVMGIGLVVFLISGVLFEPAIGHVIAKGSFGAAFRFKEWWPVFKVNLGGYLLATAFVFGLTFFLTFVIQFLYLTVVLCLLWPFVVSFLGLIIGAAGYSLYAVAYRDGVRQLAGTAVSSN